ncbi:uncharacterized protein CTHT_0045480 [Thermochaetoides thermophila DSM 1495]|uniref:Uncharacterized protein n=1 Tax=Chaetomium thermophilum (strain DSM 1495 / CBS 144.50 / IMI 039719) TaxID=759272 RepID=G0S9D7_CHATD|nr:hypothetical protein CTHT_0045480 [Thermochaetoides thermophila DSM 1495]EGS20048.1 hypothetical protein CTHT_0045480 [Thermochaetoides thermophila DSM 1495]
MDAATTLAVAEHASAAENPPLQGPLLPKLLLLRLRPMRECAPCPRESSGPRSRVRTKNADIEYRELITEDPVKAYSCMCLCQPPFTKAEEEEEEEGGVNPREVFHKQFIYYRLRVPDFRMYTFNDHKGYGLIEMLQNIFLNYEKARKVGNWKRDNHIASTKNLNSIMACYIATAKKLRPYGILRSSCLQAFGLAMDKKM